MKKHCLCCRDANAGMICCDQVQQGRMIVPSNRGPAQPRQVDELQVRMEVLVRSVKSAAL